MVLMHNITAESLNYCKRRCFGEGKASFGGGRTANF